LRACERGVDLARLRASIPAPGALGLSMADLQEAARRQGLPLRGVKLSIHEFPLEHPAIVLMKEGDRGHYVVVQPTGTTGTVALLLDFPHPPRSVDYTDLLARPDWTGLALVPKRSNWLAWATGGVAVASGLALARTNTKRRL
jgi:ABC-type bacteriocin/lantibiotic exporter with double-glycine peptidase domain